MAGGGFGGGDERREIFSGISRTRERKDIGVFSRFTISGHASGVILRLFVFSFAH